MTGYVEVRMRTIRGDPRHVYGYVDCYQYVFEPDSYISDSFRADPNDMARLMSTAKWDETLVFKFGRARMFIDSVDVNPGADGKIRFTLR